MALQAQRECSGHQRQTVKTATRQSLAPFITTVPARLHGGEEMQDPQAYAKADLFFPSGESLPRCWLDPHYQL